MNEELSTIFTGRELINLHFVISTNRELAKLFFERKLPEGTALRADFQTAGRGRGVSQWQSEQGKNLLVSFLFEPHFLSAKKIFLFNKAIALGVYDFLSSFLSEVKIKWSNDIYAGDKKICGMLIENSLRGMSIQYSIVGIGLNINQEIFPPDIPNPTSLKIITGKNFSIDDCYVSLCNSIESRYLQLKACHEEKINHDYLSALYRYNEMDWYEDIQGRFMGKIKDVDEKGRLVITREKGKEEKYMGKELKFII
jgi:BirA family biotin operon repressor/biotin-[acetyl-CoA-carboxylase] ligase